MIAVRVGAGSSALKAKQELRLSASLPNAGPQDISVVGASAGGVEALQQLVHQLPGDYPGTLLLVLHMARGGKSVLPELIARVSQLPVIAPCNSEPLEPGKIYVAVPDHHLRVDVGAVRVVKGPTLHRSRPAVDVLFRSAALAYGPRVVGVVLTGMLDDGTAGLLEIKQRGGIAVVQDPAEALFSDMPSNALRSVPIDHCLPLVRIPRLLVQLAHNSERRPTGTAAVRLVKSGIEVPGQAMNENAKPSAYSCPDCHGVLWELADEQLTRFRCRVGHGFSAQSLEAAQDDAVEDALWAAVRSLEEQASLARRMADHWRARKAESMARQLEMKAERGEGHAVKLREVLMSDELEANARTQ